jgi:predicted TIM-barrel fold metal-dependent hydrolase
MLELEHGFRILDVNARVEPDQQRRPSQGLGDPEQLEREMHQAGVVRAIVYPDTRSGSYLKANNAVARMSVGRPLVAFARVTGNRDPNAGARARLRELAGGQRGDHTTPEDIEQYAYDDRFHGFKLHPPQDGLPSQRVLEQLATVSQPLLVHGSSAFPPSSVATELLGYDMPVILSHFGGYPLDTERMREAIDLLGEHDTLYLDTSVVRYRTLLEQAIREHPDRVLFGSGTPHVHPNVAVMEILTLDVPEDAMKKVFSNNPSRVVDALAAEQF